MLGVLLDLLRLGEGGSSLGNKLLLDVVLLLSGLVLELLGLLMKLLELLLLGCLVLSIAIKLVMQLLLLSLLFLKLIHLVVETLLTVFDLVLKLRELGFVSVKLFFQKTFFFLGFVELK